MKKDSVIESFVMFLIVVLGIFCSYAFIELLFIIWMRA